MTNREALDYLEGMQKHHGNRFSSLGKEAIAKAIEALTELTSEEPPEDVREIVADLRDRVKRIEAVMFYGGRDDIGR